MKNHIFRLIILSLILLFPYGASARETDPGEETEDSPYLFPERSGDEEDAGEAEEKKSYPRELLDEDEEAPRYIFDMELGDVNADVFWEGYWRYRFTYGTGFENGKDGFKFPEAYPGLRDGFEFAQEPDFFLSVLLLDHYFVEFSFAEGYDKNTYAMGYVGDETTTVKEIRIGNSKIGIGEYEGIDVSSPEYNTPGAMARFETARSQHEVMVRYDPTEEQSKTFIGEYEIDEEILELPDYQQGRAFILPNRNIGNLEIYVQDPSGEHSGSDGRRYTASDIPYSADLAGGFVTLVNDPGGRVLIYYTSGGSPVGDAVVSEFIMDSDGRGRPDPAEDLLPFSWTEENPYSEKPSGGYYSFAESARVTVNGRNALLVHNPGEFSNFQMYNRYAFNQSLPSESWRTIISLVDSGKLTDEDMDYSFDTGSDESGNSNLLTVEIENSDSRSPYNRIPFAAENPEVYGPGHETEGDKVSREILLATKSESDNYFLGTNIIKGSVNVYVNGVEDKTVDVDYDTGKLYFSRYIFSDDRIVVTYRTESSGLTGGDLFIAQGNRLFLSEASTLELAESLRWTLPENEMTEEPGESPGEMNMAATWFYDTENLDAMVHGGMTISTSDTAGNLRIQGMEDSGYTFSVSLDSVFPAENDLSPSPTTASYDSSDREDLLYKDYERTDSSGQTYLNNYSWSGADVKSGKEGPSVAAARENDDFNSRVMVMSYDLNDGEWSGGDFTPIEDEEIDLSGYSELSFYLRRQNLGDDNLKLSVIIGDNGESEDYDDDDETELGDERFVYEENITLDLPSAEDVWQKVTLDLNDSDWDRLTRVRSIRFILSSSGGNSYGDLLAAGFEVEGSPLLLTVTDASGREKDADGVTLVEKSDSSLSDSFSEVESIFHPDGEDQKILHMEWSGSGIEASDTIRGESWFNSVPTGDYGEFSLYIRNRQTEGSGTIELTDSEGKGVVLTYAPGSTTWEKLTVDLQNGSADFSGGSDVTSLSIDKDTEKFTRFNVSRTGLASGIMELDEIHFSEPLFTAGSSLETSLEYKIPGVIRTMGNGFPVLADFDVSTKLNYYTWTSDSYFDQESRRVESQLSSGTDLMNVRLEGDFELIWTDSATSYAGGHLIRIPSQSRWGWLQDEYTRSFDPGKDTMSRTDTLHLTPFRMLTLEADTSATTTEETITQGWGGWLSLNPEELTAIRYSMDLYQTSEWSSDSSDYAGDWSRDFKYIKRLEDQDDVETREGLSSFTLSRRPDPVGVDLELKLEYDASQESDWEQENKWVSDLSFPIQIASLSSPWTITPGYRRDLNQTVYPERYDEGFSDDLDTLFTTLESQFPLTHYAPFYEIFGHKNLDDFLDTMTEAEKAEYKPRVYLNINRQTGSHIRDLFVPSGVDVSIQREYYASADSSYIQHDWNFQLVQTAVNLFGAWGRYPSFDFYATDEISSSFQLVLGGYDLWTPEPEELVYQNYITLAGEKTWTVMLENIYTRKWSGDYTQDDLALKFGWQEAEMPYVKFPFVKYLVMKPAHMEHEESLTFTGYFDDESWADTTYDTVLRHQSKLVISELGSIMGWMALGLGGKEDVYRNGFELGLELELTF